MGAADVRRALAAMGDDDVRQRLSEGDFSSVDGLVLNQDEEDLVRGAAADYPETVGFAFDGIIGFDPSAYLNFTLAMNYAEGNPEHPYMLGSNWNGQQVPGGSGTRRARPGGRVG